MLFWEAQGNPLDTPAAAGETRFVAVLTDRSPAPIPTAGSPAPATTSPGTASVC
jgi:hypothetical protein